MRKGLLNEVIEDKTKTIEIPLSEIDSIEIIDEDGEVVDISVIFPEVEGEDILGSSSIEELKEMVKMFRGSIYDVENMEYDELLQVLQLNENEISI